MTHAVSRTSGARARSASKKRACAAASLQADHIRSIAPIEPTGVVIEYIGPAPATPQHMRLTETAIGVDVGATFQRVTGLDADAITRTGRIH